MLYRCDCKTFNIKNNNYRKFCIALAISYSKYFFCNYFINNIGIFLFEPGGLLDESIIIQEILSYIVNMKYVLNVFIYIIEPYEYDNLSLKEAKKYFYNKFNLYNNVTINYHNDCFFIKKIIESINFDYLLFLSLDPYEYLYLNYYKNVKTDLMPILKKTDFFLDIALFSLRGFFYDCELSFLIFNKSKYEDIFLEYRLFGNNNNIKYAIKNISNLQ